MQALEIRRISIRYMYSPILQNPIKCFREWTTLPFIVVGPETGTQFLEASEDSRTKTGTIHLVDHEFFLEKDKRVFSV